MDSKRIFARAAAQTRVDQLEKELLTKYSDAVARCAWVHTLTSSMVVATMAEIAATRDASSSAAISSLLDHFVGDWDRLRTAYAWAFVETPAGRVAEMQKALSSKAGSLYDALRADAWGIETITRLSHTLADARATVVKMFTEDGLPVPEAFALYASAAADLDPRAMDDEAEKARAIAMEREMELSVMGGAASKRTSGAAKKSHKGTKAKAASARSANRSSRSSSRSSGGRSASAGAGAKSESRKRTRA
mgnify:CR=1 FL=1